MPLLHYFSNANITALNSDQDLLYFNLPFGGFVTYSFNWIIPMLLVAGLLFIILVIYGLRKERLHLISVAKGFIPLLLSLSLSGIVTYVFWKLCLLVYPEYLEMEHGFTYNGYWYIALSIFLALGLSFYTYHWFRQRSLQASIFVAPIILWLVICALIAFYLKGASYFIVPVYFALLQFYIMLRQLKPNRILMVLLSFPAIILILPFIWSLPVALGLKNLFLTAVLVSLVFTLLLPLFAYFRKLKVFAFLCWVICIALFFIAHLYSGFSAERPKPNSLVYLKDMDQQQNFWYSYDQMKDDWTTTYFNHNASSPGTESSFSSKYGSNFKQKANAPNFNIPEPGILLEAKKVDTASNWKFYTLKIAPNRDIHRMELYETRDLNFKFFKVNDLVAQDETMEGQTFHMQTRRWKERILTYHASNRDTLRIEFAISPKDEPEFVLYESAYDLFDVEGLKLKERSLDMIPRPFVLNDATILKKTIRIKE